MTIRFRNSAPTYFILVQVPGGAPQRVRLIQWIGADRTHARVEFTATGRRVSVPATLLAAA